MYLKTLFSFVKYRELSISMGFRELKVFNKGAVLGIIWLVINPMIQTLAYVIVVTFIFKVKFSLGNSGGGIFDYAIYILSGMIPWQILTKSFQEAPSLIRNNTELIKQVIYPIEILPVSNIIKSSFGTLISFIILFVLLIVSNSLNIYTLLIPLPICFMFLFIIGISWIFSIVGIILKDLREMVTVFFSLLVYLSPVVLNEKMVSKKIWYLIQFNPLSHIIICFRDVFFGEFHLISWIIFVSISIFFYLLGGWIIQKSKVIINEYI